jgi:phosphate transport system substrate-binding protein
MRHFQLTPRVLRSDALAGDNDQRLKLLSEHPTGIAYLSVGEAERAMAAGMPIRPLPQDGVPATSRAIERGHYGLARPLTLVTARQSGALAKAFVAFCASSLVTDVIRAHDFVPYLD